MPNQQPEVISFKTTISINSCITDFLAEKTGLSKGRIKDALTKGAVRVKRTGSKEKRIRKAKFCLRCHDRLLFHYDARILAAKTEPADCLADYNEYSVWFKPPGMVTQGTDFGDHCALIRFIEKAFPNRPVKLIHRLDREAFGLLVVGHSKKCAALLSRMLQQNKIEKRYMAEVHGKPGRLNQKLLFTKELDNKKAETKATIIGFDQQQQTTFMDITITTGRYHQIRRHLHLAGHPLVGDPLYRLAESSHNKTLQLCAWKIRFPCPFHTFPRDISLTRQYLDQRNIVSPLKS